MLRPFFIRSLTSAAVLALCVATATTGCSDDPVDDNQNNNQAQNDNNNDDEPISIDCEADTWSCDEFVGGADMDVDRNKHYSVALDNELVLLFSGSYRVDGDPGEAGSASTDTWEVFNVEEDEVEVGEQDFEVPRRDPSVIQLEDGSVVLVGGVDDDGDRLSSVKYFSSDSLDWTPLEEMDAPYREAIQLNDGRILALGIGHGSDPPRIISRSFDLDDLDWSSEPTADLLDDSVDEYAFHQMDDDRLFFVYSYRAPEADQPDVDDDADIDPTVYERVAVAYDLEAGEVEELNRFDEQTFGYDFDVVELPNSGDLLWHIVTYDFDDDPEVLSEVPEEAVGLRYDVDTGEFDEPYRRDITDIDPSRTAQILQVFPGDEILVDLGRPLQMNDVDDGAWYDFRGFPDDKYYESMTLMPDCRLFASGDLPFDWGEEDERIQTGQCLVED